MARSEGWQIGEDKVPAMLLEHIIKFWVKEQGISTEADGWQYGLGGISRVDASGGGTAKPGQEKLAETSLLSWMTWRPTVSQR